MISQDMEDEVYLVVKAITLLSADEANELTDKIRDVSRRWWLKSPGAFSDFAAFVRVDGSVSDTGDFVGNEEIGVRPVLVIEYLDSLKLVLYQKLEIFDKDWLYIGNNRALSKDVLFCQKFDKASNDYEGSEIERCLDKWLEKIKKEFEE